MKTLREFLRIEEVKKPKEHLNFFLYSSFKNNPTDFCPSCESTEVRRLHTHNPDGMDFECYACRQTYTLNLCDD